MASTYLNRTPSSSGSNTTWTFSAWIKRAGLGLDTVPFATGYSSPQIDESIINIGADDQLRFNININDVTDVTVRSSRKLRDTSAWYHIVVKCDTTQATASDRVKFYFNGEEETNLATTDYPTQNQSTFFGDTSKEQKIGLQPRSSNYFDGQMAHVHFIDGTAYDADTFGETDSTTGIWKPKTAPSVTYGTNGFFLKFENSGSMGTDSSGNGNNFTVNGTMTQTIDTPSNVFATGNALIPSTDFLSNGNNTATSSGAFWRTAYSTLAVSSGKYYFEAKQSAGGNSIDIGICEVTQASYNEYPGQASRSWGYHNNNVIYNNGATLTNVSTYTTGDIISVALDLDNNYVYFGKNGTWQNSGDPTSGASGTGGFAITSGYDYTFCFGDYSGSSPQANFGNGYFGTTAVASAQNPDDGIGIFEYSVPTGYKALCTKSINSQEYD